MLKLYNHQKLALQYAIKKGLRKVAQIGKHVFYTDLTEDKLSER